MKTRIFTNRNKRSARWALLIRQSMKVNTWAPEVSKIRPLCPSILFNIHMLILNIYNYIHIITYIDTLCIYIYCYTMLYHLIPSYTIIFKLLATPSWISWGSFYQQESAEAEPFSARSKRIFGLIFYSKTTSMSYLKKWTRSISIQTDVSEKQPFFCFALNGGCTTLQGKV
jgi:hypothetical protein